jgi:hypothetical protein
VGGIDERLLGAQYGEGELLGPVWFAVEITERDVYALIGHPQRCG